MNRKKQQGSNLQTPPVRSRLFRAAQLLVFVVASMAMILSTPKSAEAQDCSDVLSPLSQFVTDNVNTNKAFYIRAMNETGVPWEMLAAIHYRETAFSHSNPGNGQGIFQFSNADGGPYPPGPVSDDEFYRQLKLLATKLQNDYVWRGDLPRERRQLRPGETNVALVKDTLFSYNGRAAVYAAQAAQFGFSSDVQPYEGSPYVMNRFDCPRARMGIITHDFGSLDGTDTRYGAFTIFARLRGDDYWRSLWSSPYAGLGDTFILAKSDDPSDLRQWVLYGGIKQYVPDAQTVYAWGLQNQQLVTVSSGALNAFATGPNLDRLMRWNGQSAVYFVDNGKRYLVPWQSMLDAWDIGGVTISSVSTGLYNLLGDGGALSWSVKDPNSSNVYMVDGDNGSGQVTLRQYPSDAFRHAWEGDTSWYTEVSGDYWNRIKGNIGAPLSGTKISFGGQEYQVAAGYRFSEPVGVAPLYPGVAQAVSAATFNRLTAGSTASQLIQSSSSPTVYLLDNGVRHPILWPDALTAWTAAGTGITPVDDNYLSLIPTGAPVGTYMADVGGQLYVLNGDGTKTPVPSSLDGNFRKAGGVYTASSTLMNLFPNASTSPTEFIRGAHSAAVYLLDNSGVRHHVTSPEQLMSWGGDQTGVTVLPDYLVNSLGTGNDLSAYVSDGSNEFMLDGGQKLPISPSVKSAWGLSNPQVFSDGTLSRFATGSNLTTNFRANGFYVMVANGSAYLTVDPDIAAAWNIQNAPQYGAGMLGTARWVMLTRYVSSSAPGDGRTFLVDNGQWFNLPTGQYNNLNVAQQPLMSLDPSLAPGTITDFNGPVIKNSQGTYYVIDGGGKRSFANPTIQDYWTNSGQINAPVVSDGFLHSLPTLGTMERVIKGSDPAVYAAPAAVKEHIITQDTYRRLFAPFAPVSDALVNALPTGEPIQ